MRFIKQQDSYSCSPIAIMNAMKWANKLVTLKDLPLYKRLTFCSKLGTNVNNITKALSHLPFKSKLRKRFTLKTLEKQLEIGGSFIMCFKVPDSKKEIYHSAFFFRKHKNRWVVANFNPNTQKYALTFETNNTLNQILKDTGMYSPLVWLLSKLDKQ